jgi:hypothetical protein
MSLYTIEPVHRDTRATAVIGLLLYSVTLLLCLYLTWTEFTEIIPDRQLQSKRGPDFKFVKHVLFLASSNILWSNHIQLDCLQYELSKTTLILFVAPRDLLFKSC